MKKLVISMIFFSIIIVSGCVEKSFHSINTNNDLIVTVNMKEKSITFVDAKEKKVITTWLLEKSYVGGFFLDNHDTLLLYSKDSDLIDLYSLKKGKKIKSWKVGTGIVNGQILYSDNDPIVVFADQFKQKIRFFDLKGKELESISVGKNPFTLLESKSSKQLYVISFDQKIASVIDINNRKVIKNFEIHPSAAGALINEEKRELWIGGHGEGNNVEKYIHVYNMDSGKLMKKIEAPVMPINFIQNEQEIFVLSHGSSTLYKISLDQAIQQKKIGANPFEIASVGHEIVIAGYDSNDIHFIDPYSFKVNKAISVGEGPFKLIIREHQK